MAHTRCYLNGVLNDHEFDVHQLSEHLEEPGAVVWVDLCAPDMGELELVAEELGLHALAVEDAVHAHQRPSSTATRTTASCPRMPYAWTATAASWSRARWPPSSPRGRW